MTENTRDHPRFCVIGAGHGGTALAAYLALSGYRTNLYNRSEDRLTPIKLLGGIELIRHEPDILPHGVGQLNCVTNDPAEALQDTDVVMVAVPANGHRFVAEACAPHLRDGHVVVLNPGRTGGALEFSHVLHEHGVAADVIVAEAQTFIYASRSVNPAQVQIFRVKNSIPVAALPAYRTPEVITALHDALPQFVPGDNVIKTSLDNIGAVFHPAVTVLNSARIESTHGEFEYYIDGVSESVSRVLESLDAERVAVAAAMGFNAITARQWLYQAYDAAGDTLHRAMRANPGYYGIKAPHHLDHRYLDEDVPMSLVPIASLGEMLGVETPTIRAIIHLACLLNQRDYWADGRTAERLGLAGLSLKEIRQLILEGLPDIPGSRRTSEQA
ncbi:MAG: NAD/NADP octopine/nopaline dehydrogenase family protein [Armatimonadota bacterium]|nr:MAG: NAD/NADP octopine/nopaline dehydrogenase family protein [Armatimonadota bacterium]